MAQGVTMLDPSQTYIDATVQIGPDCTVYPGALLQGHTVIGRGCEIGPNTRLIDCVLGDEVVIEQAIGQRCEIGDNAVVGPYATLSPGTRVAAGTRTGPFFRSDVTAS